MSVYVVEKSDIALIVEFAGQNQRSGRIGLSELGQLLWDENVKSVNYRYNESNQAPRYVHQPVAGIQPMAVLKKIHCLEYQSCEHPEWEKSHAASILKQLERLVIRQLPGYAEAAW